MSNKLSAEMRRERAFGGHATTEGGMLVLSRKRSERIVIGSSIQITVLKVDGNHVRLGIEAPATLPIVRAELLSRGLGRLDDTDPGTTSSERSRSH
jgi:carbon storage regulator